MPTYFRNFSQTLIRNKIKCGKSTKKIALLFDFHIRSLKVALRKIIGERLHVNTVSENTYI